MVSMLCGAEALFHGHRGLIDTPLPKNALNRKSSKGSIGLHALSWDKAVGVEQELHLARCPRKAP